MVVNLYSTFSISIFKCTLQAYIVDLLGHLANMHKNTPQSILFSCCGMSFAVFVKKHQGFTLRLLSTCCSSIHILAMAFSADGCEKDPALLSKTRTSFSLGRTTRRNQCFLKLGLHGTRTASCFVERLLLSGDL